MACVSQASVISEMAASSPDVTLADLTQLLLRLQQNVLHATPERERRLRSSEYERAKVETVWLFHKKKGYPKAALEIQLRIANKQRIASEFASCALRVDQA